MPNWREHTEWVILTGSPSEVSKAGRVTKIAEKLRLPVMVILLLTTLFAILAPMNFKVRQGELTYQMVAGKGNVEFSLGPAGVVEVKTHKTPVNLKMSLVLDKHITDNQKVSDVLTNSIEEFRAVAIHKLIWFCVTKAVLVILFGALLFGVLWGSIDKTWLMTGKHALRGAVASFALVLTFVAATVVTFDSTPQVTNTGYASELPSPSEALKLAKSIGGNYKISSNMLGGYTNGMEMVARQRGSRRYVPSTRPAVRMLVVSDVHDNSRGMEIANIILNGELRFDAVLLTGDMTHLGSSTEVGWVFDNWPRTTDGGLSDIPKLMVGGNHENSGAMKEFKNLGYTLLGEGLVDIKGVIILGVDDPLAYSDYLSSVDSTLQTASDQLAEVWQKNIPLPQVIAVHDLDQANEVIELAKKNSQHLTVVFGHDHELSVTTEGTVTMVGGGTGGASGYNTIAHDPATPYTFQILEFSTDGEPRLLSVTSLSYSDQGGSYTTTYTPID